MPVKFENYTHSFQRDGKPVFVPSDLGRRIGEDVKKQVEIAFCFEDTYYHLKKGSHIAALHAHRNNLFFCKVDIKNFFYSVARNRVVKALCSIGIKSSAHYGKWSCVRNPYDEPTYALPYGFVQSPVLATLVLEKSEAGKKIRQLAQTVTVSVYMDDIALSSNDLTILDQKYHELIQAINAANFNVNNQKCVTPCEKMTIFNCSLKKDETLVTPERIKKFTPKSPASQDGFNRYCESVKEGNC